MYSPRFYTYLFFSSTLLFVSNFIECNGQTPTPEDNFVADYKDKGPDIQRMFDQLNVMDSMGLCMKVLNTDDVNIGYEKLENSVTVKPQEVTVNPIKCTLTPDNEAYFCLSSTQFTIYILEKNGEDFKYKDTKAY